MAAVATSQNSWPVYTSQRSLAVNEYITGRVRSGDVYTILHYAAQQFHLNVEAIRRHWSWGWAYRAIRGKSSGYSNHASATAEDLNAPWHPLGKRGTFTSRQVREVRKILKALRGCVRWGEDYNGRADGMHFEINLRPGSKVIAEVAAAIRNGTINGSVAIVPPSEPVVLTAIPRYYTRKPWMEIPVDGSLNGLTMSALQWRLNIKPTGKLDHFTIRALKAWLGKDKWGGGDDGRGILSPYNIAQLQDRTGATVDEIWGPDTTRHLQAWLNAHRHL